MLSVERVYSATRINAVANHPSVRPFVGLPDAGPLDFTAFVADSRNHVVVGQGGGFLLQWLEPGVYEVHTQFLPEARGRIAAQATVDMQRLMFGWGDASHILTKVPTGNVAATALVRKMKMTPLPSTDSAALYSKTMWNWAIEADSSSDFEIWPGAAGHVAGLALEMAAHGQIEKALAFHGRWARLAGCQPMTVIAANPFVFDVGMGLVAIENNLPKVVLCRQQ